jgi:hypothetical protein
MNKNQAPMKHKIVYLLLLILFSIVSNPGQLFAQESEDQEKPEPLRTYLNLTVTYLSNDSVELLSSCYTRKGRVYSDLMNVPVAYHAYGTDDTTSFGIVPTDSAGKSRLVVPLPLPKDADGFTHYTADFAGTPQYLPSSSSFDSRPASLKVSFYEEDSVKYIQVDGTKTTNEGSIGPIAEESVYLFVPSLFRPLPIGEIWLDEQGTGFIEFPTSLIGDSSGMILVIARIDDHGDFGYVKGEAPSSWAIPKHLLAQDKPTRELWTPVAPLWMIITLIILLAGVWGHYIYAVIALIKIKKNEPKSEE